MSRLTKKSALGATGLEVPPIVFGTSCLGNLYQALPYETKLEIVRQMFQHVDAPVVLDSAGKYGAGLALEIIGRCLRELEVTPQQAVISNKLAWVRTPLTAPEPTFEPGVWADLQHDAQQRLGYDGIMQCYEDGCRLLGEPYRPQLVSVHDPDEYLAAAVDEADRRRRWNDVLESYRALGELRDRGEVAGVGVGAKDWQVIRRLTDEVKLDWVMFACSLTVMQHPPELLSLIYILEATGVGVINSAVFHAGFLTGGKFFDYRPVDAADPADRPLFEWREQFYQLCAQHDVPPAAACVQFGLSVPGVSSVALNTGRPERIAQNVDLVQTDIPPAFWLAMRDAALIDREFPYVG